MSRKHRQRKARDYSGRIGKIEERIEREGLRENTRESKVERLQARLARLLDRQTEAQELAELENEEQEHKDNEHLKRSRGRLVSKAIKYGVYDAALNDDDLEAAIDQARADAKTA